jgi:PIN domain nuclease of toxin-antitoxin system
MAELSGPADWVLDASAVLAFLQGEPGAARLEARLARSAICSVNLAEVAGKLLDVGMPEPEAREAVEALGLTVVAFDEELAWRAALLRSAGRRHGLSLGDRACLATALTLGRPVVGCDRAWCELGLSVEVELLR